MSGSGSGLHGSPRRVSRGPAIHAGRAPAGGPAAPEGGGRDLEGRGVHAVPALDQPRQTTPRDAPSDVEANRKRARLSAWYAHVRRRQGRRAEAIRWARRAIEEAKASDEQEGPRQRLSDPGPDQRRARAVRGRHALPAGARDLRGARATWTSAPRSTTTSEPSRTTRAGGTTRSASTRRRATSGSALAISPRWRSSPPTSRRSCPTEDSWTRPSGWAVRLSASGGRSG